MIYLAKILPLFVLPLGVVLLTVLFGLLTRRRWPIWGGLILLWGASLPAVGGSLFSRAEGGAGRQAAADVPTADAVVVLSAGRVVAPGTARISEWGDPDRFFGGLDLLRAGRAPVIVFTGGWLPWEPDAPLEGDVLSDYAHAAGVPADRILKTGRVSNTADEATAVSVLLRARQATRPRILLVTSAFHMRRAVQLFERANLEVLPFPVDFSGSTGGLSVLDFLPSPGGLAQTHIALRELYGYWFYRLSDQ